MSSQILWVFIFVFVCIYDGVLSVKNETYTCSANARNISSVTGRYVKDVNCPRSPKYGNQENSQSRWLEFLSEPSHAAQETLVLPVGSHVTDGLTRLIRSAIVYGFIDNVEVLGLGQPWKGGNMNYAGGGYKVNLLKEKLEAYKNDKDKIIIATDGYDVIYLSDLETIVKKFKSMDARVLFSAERQCWPDKSLASKYPSVIRGVRFLNSGGFMGYASDLYEILQQYNIRDHDDDQLFYTNIYLDKELREKHKIKLDHKSEIFQNLYDAVADVALEWKGDEAYLQNTASETIPLIVHGNGKSKLVLNSLGNYLAQAWNRQLGCLNCRDGTVDLPEDKPDAWPTILIGIFIDSPTPFVEEFLQKVYSLAYPKSKIHLFVYNAVPYHEKVVEDFLAKHGKEYKSLKQIAPRDDIKESAARNLAVDRCLQKDCSGFFHVDAVAHLDNNNTLNLLVEQNRKIVAPMLVRPGETWSNFWAAIAENGFYARGADYMDIVHNERRGLWNVPYITHCYLVNATVLRNEATRPTYSSGGLDFDMSFAKSNRDNNIFMFVSNRVNFGHLINTDDYDIKRTSPELYEIYNNKLDWESRYIHSNYTDVFEPGAKPLQPCPDVFWFPIVTDRFTKEFVELVEGFGQWSNGKNEDPRIEGGYENVPTRDIHMKQISFDSHWLTFLKDYVRPLQELVFTGYVHDPPRSHMNFVVRYRPDEQPSLRPHHDSSTYTINIALNTVGVDYEGGGCRFLRYNCSVTATKRGWMLMHPGRLTHYHEGLLVTKGTRYIMISFVDP